MEYNKVDISELNLGVLDGNDLEEEENGSESTALFGRKKKKRLEQTLKFFECLSECSDECDENGEDVGGRDDGEDGDAGDFGDFGIEIELEDSCY